MTPFPSPPKGMRIPCRQNPERQFPNEKNPAQIEAAKTVCRRGDSGRRCPFFDECLSIGLRYQTEGIWGATTARERAKIRERTGQVALPLALSEAVPRRFFKRAS